MRRSGRSTTAPTASGPAQAPTPTSSIPPTSSAPSSRSPRSNRTPRTRGVRATRPFRTYVRLRYVALGPIAPNTIAPGGRCTPRSVKGAETRGGPDEDEGAADHGGPFDGAERAGVAGVEAVVSHHEQLVRRHLVRSEVGERDGRILEVGLVELPAVDVDVAPFDLHGLPVGGDKPLDEVPFRGPEPQAVQDRVDEPSHGAPLRCRRRFLGRGDEDDDVASFGLREVIDELRDQDAVVFQQRVLHRLRRDEERLD